MTAAAVNALARAGTMSAGTALIGVGVGPGDPELMTLKAMRALGEADVVALFRQGRQCQPFARDRRAQHLRAGVTELPLYYPVTTELPSCSDRYRDAIREFYDGAAATIAAHLEAGRVVARDRRRRSAVLRLLHASAHAAGAALLRPRSSPASPACRAAGRRRACRSRRATTFSPCCRRRCRKPNCAPARAKPTPRW